MKVERVLQRLISGGFSQESVRHAGSALGHELLRRRLDVLRAFRSGLAGLKAQEDRYAEGYLMALADVASSYERSVAESNSKAETLSHVMRKSWLEVLVALGDTAKRPSELAAELVKNPATITRTLTSLREEGLVENFAQKTESDGRIRLNRLTLRGADVVRAAALSSTEQTPTVGSDEVDGENEAALSLLPPAFHPTSVAAGEIHQLEDLVEESARMIEGISRMQDRILQKLKKHSPEQVVSKVLLGNVVPSPLPVTGFIGQVRKTMQRKPSSKEVEGQDRPSEIPSPG